MTITQRAHHERRRHPEAWRQPDAHRRRGHRQQRARTARRRRHRPRGWRHADGSCARRSRATSEYVPRRRPADPGRRGDDRQFDDHEQHVGRAAAASATPAARRSTLVNSTVSHNTATGGGSTGGNLSALNGTIRLQNTIVAQGIGTNPDLDPAGGTYTSLDYNQIDSGTITRAAHDILASHLGARRARQQRRPDRHAAASRGSAVIDVDPGGGRLQWRRRDPVDQRGIAPAARRCVATSAPSRPASRSERARRPRRSATSGSPSIGGQTVDLHGDGQRCRADRHRSPSSTARRSSAPARCRWRRHRQHHLRSAPAAMSITATYSGDAANAQSTSPRADAGRAPCATTTAVVPSANPIAPGASVTFTATVTPAARRARAPTGTVALLRRRGAARRRHARGRCRDAHDNGAGEPGERTTSRPSTPGSAIYNGSTSPVLVETVTGGAAPRRPVVSSLNPSTFGSAVTFTATVSVPNGTPTGTVDVQGRRRDDRHRVAVRQAARASFATSALAVGHARHHRRVCGRRRVPRQHVARALAGRQRRRWRQYRAPSSRRSAIDTQPVHARESLPLDLASAMALTNPGGEVIIVDSAGYGPTVITKPISIIAPSGVYRRHLGDQRHRHRRQSRHAERSRLRGLTINGLGGATGIDFQSGAALYVERTLVSGFTGAGLNATLPAAGGALRARLGLPRQRHRRVARDRPWASSYRSTRRSIARSSSTTEPGIALTGFSATAAIRRLDHHRRRRSASRSSPRSAARRVRPTCATRPCRRNTTAGIVVGGNGAATRDRYRSSARRSPTTASASMRRLAAPRTSPIPRSCATRPASGRSPGQSYRSATTASPTTASTARSTATVPKQ